MNRQDDERSFRAFVNGSRWRFAKTYVDSFPHEYTLDEWCDEKSFDAAIQCIERWGEIEPFFTSRRKYFYLDDRFYWHMGDPSSDDPEEQPGLINRSWTDVSRYRDEAQKLGYDGERLERLVLRWTSLLEKAKRTGDSA